MKCLVLGGGGFIGSNLCAALLADGQAVRVLEYPHVAGQCQPDIRQRIEWIEGDFTNPSDVDAAVVGCDAVFHLISTTLPKSSNDNPVYDIESNLVATVRLLDAMLREGVGKIVFSSSGGTIYGVPRQVPIPETHPTDPLCSYGITKLAIEKYLHLYHVLHGLDYRVLRLANPYGEGQRAIASQGAVTVFMHRAVHDEEIEIWGDGKVTRDYVHIADVAMAMRKALHYSGPMRTFNIGSGAGISLNTLLAEISAVLGRDVRHRHLPARQFDVPINILDVELARRELGWEPAVTLTAGLKRTLDWVRDG